VRVVTNSAAIAGKRVAVRSVTVMSVPGGVDGVLQADSATTQTAKTRLMTAKCAGFNMENL
jgi:hypothetical protein